MEDKEQQRFQVNLSSHPVQNKTKNYIVNNIMRSCLQSKQCKQYLFMFVYKVFNFIFFFFAE